jgi:hypothetical protein
MEETIGGVLLERCELPDSQNNSKTTKAEKAIIDHLSNHQYHWVSRQALVEIAIRAANLKERQAVDALKEVINQLGATLEQQELPTKGKPKQYRLIAPLPEATTPSDLMQTKPCEELLIASDGNNDVNNGKGFDAGLNCIKSALHQMPDVIASNTQGVEYEL